jgi:type II secretory pathway component GspD/PulD (secretin)
MPATDVIKAEIGNAGQQVVSIGTFLSPPGNAARKVIIDVHDDKLIAVAPASVMEKLVAIARRGVAEGEARAERVKQADSMPSGVQGQASDEMSVSEKENVLLRADEQEPDKAFKELLDSIAEAEKTLAEQEKTSQSQPAGVEPLAEIVTQPKATEEHKEPSETPIPDQAEMTPGPNAPDESAAAETNPASPNGYAEANKPEPANPYEPQVIPNADETLELALPEELKVIDLLDLVGKYLNLNYVYDKKKIETLVVNLKVQRPVKVSELYPLVESVLKFTGLAMTRKGNLVTIVPLAEVLDYDPVLIGADGGQVHAGDVVATSIFQLNYIDTTQAKAMLDGMRVGAVTEMPGMGTLIVTGYAYRMSRVEQLLEIIDKPGKPKQFKFRQLKYTMATTLAPKVKQLVEQLGDISIQIATPQTSPPQPGRRVPTRRPMPPQPTQPTSPSGSAKPSIYLDADERTNRILMIGSEGEIAVVENLIDALDVEQQDIRSIRVYEIQHVGAEEVRKKLEELGVIGAGKATTPGRITARAARAAAAAAQPGAPPSPTPTPAGAEAALPTEEVQVVIIESTNSLMVNASPEQHALVATIIAYVDSETIQQAIPYVVYPLENQNPADLADVLNKLIQETILDKEGKIQQVVQRQEEQIVIVPDESTFSLIVFASKKNQEWIASLVKSMDRRRPQVLIDVTLVEVTKTDTFQYDLDMVSKFPDLSPGGQMEYLPALLGNPAAGTAAGTTFPQTRVTEATSYSGRGQGFYADRHIQALLTIMQEKSYGRILAKPKILVNDNETGKIVAQDTTYVEKRSSTQVQTGGEQNNLITSIDYAGYDAGITLDIKPHISEGDLLRLEIALTRSDFDTATITGLRPPDTKTSDISTVVTVPDGSTIILGGLIKLKQGKAVSKVPLLGDIPLVGGLFRSIDNRVNDSKLYVFVKANILRPETAMEGLPELVNISDKNRAAFEKHEEEFQKHQDWPGVKPKPVDPVHVIDAE